MSDYDTQIQVEDQYDSLREENFRELHTYACEPASEDGTNIEGLLAKERYKDVLQGYAEDRYYGSLYLDQIAPYGSEDIDYSYSDGREF